MTHQGANPGGGYCVIGVVAMICLLFGAVTASGQNATTPPSSPRVFDSSTDGPALGSSPAKTTDGSAQASPVLAVQSGIYLPISTEISISLRETADSGRARNGETLPATLTAPVRASDGSTLPIGTHVGVTVLAAAKAGQLESRGELTLQVTHVGSVAALTDAQTFFGKEGHKDLPDAAPAKGTEASVAPSATLRFRVAPSS